MLYSIRAYRRARRGGRICDVVTAMATADTPERAEEIRREFAEGHPDSTVEVAENKQVKPFGQLK